MAKSATDVVFCYVALGSNIGESVAYLHKAIKAIESHPLTINLQTSNLYQSKPHGPQDQPDYINAAVSFYTSLEPEELLNFLQQIENDNARVRKGVQRWGARTLDLDLLFYGEQTINTCRLTVPHPRICERVFVLYPLRDLLKDAEESLQDLKINQSTTLQDCIDDIPEAEINNIKDIGYA